MARQVEDYGYARGLHDFKIGILKLARPRGVSCVENGSARVQICLPFIWFQAMAHGCLPLRHSLMPGTELSCGHSGRKFHADTNETKGSVQSKTKAGSHQF